MKIHNVAQGSPEWHALRAGHNTASEASAMMGVSKNTTRSELLRIKVTGSEKEYSEWVQRNLLDRGHEIEAVARPFAENHIGEELYPCTATSDEYPQLLASFDGVTMMEDIIFECKSWNESKAAAVREGAVPKEDYWQVVQQLVVSRAEKALYVVTDGAGRTVWCWMELDERDERDLLAGWAQFDEDKANYQPTEAKPVVVAAPVAGLPSINYQLNGLALTSNLKVFRAAAEQAVLDSKKPLETDQDFADREALNKAFGEAEAKIKLVREQVIGEIKDVDSFCRELGEIGELIRQARLAGEKQVTTRKDAIKASIRQKGIEAFAAHVAAINQGLEVATLPRIADNFAGVMKGKRTLASIQDAVDTELARLKIEANSSAEKIRANIRSLRMMAGEMEFLFPDQADLVLKDGETVKLIVQQRLDEHAKAEAARLDAERERIREEEAQRLEDERKAEEQQQAPIQESPAPVTPAQETTPAHVRSAPATAVPIGSRTMSFLNSARPSVTPMQSGAPLKVVDLKELAAAIGRGDVPVSVIAVNEVELVRAWKSINTSMYGVQVSEPPRPAA